MESILGQKKLYDKNPENLQMAESVINQWLDLIYASPQQQQQEKERKCMILN